MTMLLEIFYCSYWMVWIRWLQYAGLVPLLLPLKLVLYNGFGEMFIECGRGSSIVTAKCRASRVEDD